MRWEMLDLSSAVLPTLSPYETYEYEEPKKIMKDIMPINSVYVFLTHI